MTPKKAAVAILAIALLLSACQPARKPVEPVAIDPVELQAFADAFFPKQMEALHIPGLTFICLLVPQTGRRGRQTPAAAHERAG
jgi:hypothetical protein